MKTGDKWGRFRLKALWDKRELIDPKEGWQIYLLLKEREKLQSDHRRAKSIQTLPDWIWFKPSSN